MSGIEDLEVCEVEDGRGKVAGERVILEINGSDEGALREGGGDGAAEAVGMEAELAELEEAAEVGRQGARELEAGEAELADAAGEADNAAPVTGSGGGGRRPAVERAEWVPEAAPEGEEGGHLGGRWGLLRVNLCGQGEEEEDEEERKNR